MDANNLAPDNANLLQRIIKKLRENWLIALFSWIFFFVGLAVLAWGVSGTLKALNSRSWPVAQGVVSQSSVTSKSDDDGTMYSAYVLYHYQATGRSLQSDQVSFGDYSSSNSQPMRRLVARYPQGSQVTVYYNPDKPEEAVLEPGFTSGLLIPLGIGAAFTLAGGALIFWLVRRLLSGEA